jgi:hypothetical protein
VLNKMEYLPRNDCVVIPREEGVKYIVVYMPPPQQYKQVVNYKKEDEYTLIYILLVILGLFIFFNLDTDKKNKVSHKAELSLHEFKANPPLTDKMPFKVNYNPTVTDKNKMSFKVDYNRPLTPLTMAGNISFYKSKTAPLDVVELARKHTNNEQQAKFLLALCYHERGIKNWYDNYLCGYGATDTVWYSKYSGWQKQLSYAGHRVRKWFGNRDINYNTTLGFAKYSYGTTDWKHYSQVWKYYLKMGGY